MSGDPFFLPWQGARYREGIGGVRLLLVGDSHYASDPGDAEPELTRKIVTRFMGGEPMPFFAKSASVVSGASDVAEVDVWDLVAFYNYVQNLAGATHEDIPTNEMYSNAAVPFERVLHSLKPDGLIVLCQRTWNHIGNGFPRGTISTPVDGDNTIRRWLYPSGLAVMATWTNHPSGSHGFRPADWHERIRKFLNIARGQ